MEFIKGYKKEILILLVILVIFSVVVLAAKNMEKKKNNNIKESLGSCITECVHTYNPPTTDSESLQQYPVTGFMANVCVDACKAGTYEGACSEEGGDCCNVFREDVDPDCAGIDYCAQQSDCQENFFFCDLAEEMPTCKPVLWPGIMCNEDYQCISDVCAIDPITKQGYC